MKTFILCFFIIAGQLLAQVDFKPAAKDTIVFAGDSITHQCLYTQYAENFLYTRYYDLNLHCFNAGISGDKASDLLNRFQEDVAFQKPAWVTVMLGMNDGRYQNYTDKNFAIYQQDMQAVIAAINNLKAKALLITPSMFDQQQYRLKDKAGNFRFSRLKAHENYNAKLGFYSGWIRATANDQKLNFVDFWGPLNDLTAYMRRQKADFTFMPDSIHPDPNGMAIMAAKLAQFFKGDRAQIPAVVIAVSESPEHSDNVSEFKMDEDRYTCTITPKYLPWVLTGTKEPGPAPFHYKDDPSLGFKLVMKHHDFNREIIQITGLQKGSYQLVMNDTALAKAYSHQELAQGIDISQNENSASYKQSLKLAQINAKRNNEGLRMYRGIQAKMKGQRRRLAGNPEKLAIFRKSIQADLDKFLKIADDYEKQIHQLAVPQKYLLEIKKIK